MPEKAAKMYTLAIEGPRRLAVRIKARSAWHALLLAMKDHPDSTISVRSIG